MKIRFKPASCEYTHGVKGGKVDFLGKFSRNWPITMLEKAGGGTVFVKRTQLDAARRRHDFASHKSPSMRVGSVDQDQF